MVAVTMLFSRFAILLRYGADFYFMLPMLPILPSHQPDLCHTAPKYPSDRPETADITIARAFDG